MTEKSDPRENAIAERVNGIIRNEYLIHYPVYSLVQAQAVLNYAVFVYNNHRPHLSGRRAVVICWYLNKLTSEREN
jgi:putative transposase